ncbi:MULTISPECIES: hypothetical protein [Halomonas]|uniref:hypothetical protein n=1 Tax=Halomonas TaxID=2745 RepID=UPI001866E9D9|nr:hypothetical protein [Halomonas citrativorans]
MIKALIKKTLRYVLKKLVVYPSVRRLGHKVLAPFPNLKGRIIRLLQAGRFINFTVENPVEGYGEHQQRITNGLQQRWKRDSQ